MVAVVGNIKEGIININYKVIIKVLMEVGQLDTPLISKRRHTTSFIRVQEMLEIIKSLQPTSKAS